MSSLIKKKRKKVWDEKKYGYIKKINITEDIKYTHTHTKVCISLPPVPVIHFISDWYKHTPLVKGEQYNDAYIGDTYRSVLLYWY